MTTPTMTVFYCDHMRPLVRLADGWHHVSEADGKVLSLCGAVGESGYVHREKASLPENWGAAANLVGGTDVAR